MKTLNTHWKLIAFATLAVMVTIWTGSRMEAKTGQDETAQSGRVGPQVREAAIGAFGPIGLTHGQTLRIGINGGDVNGMLILTVFDCGGNILMSNTYIPGPHVTCAVFDLNADQLPQGEFDNSGRAEVGVRFHGGGGGERIGSLSATAQVFDNLTGKTTFALQAGGHPGGIN
ncbi:MAG TPA: hypothetical protein VFF31_26980 [Blastocatellia bacterium]|nr:hypothetical protein [Blastocatellia bacterium]